MLTSQKPPKPVRGDSEVNRQMTSERDFSGPNLGYVLDLYERYRQDPGSVDEATRRLFAQWQPVEAAQTPLPDLDFHTIIGAANLAQAIRSYGYLAATLDPLGKAPAGSRYLTAGFYQLDEAQLRSLPASLIELKND